MNLIEYYGLKDVYLNVIPKLNVDKDPLTLWSHSVDVARRFAELSDKLWRPPVGPDAHLILRYGIEMMQSLVYLHDVGKVDAQFQEELKTGSLTSRHTILGLNLVVEAAEKLAQNYPKELRPTLIYLTSLATTLHHVPLMKTTLSNPKEHPDASLLPYHLQAIWEQDIRNTITHLKQYRKELTISGWELHWVFSYLSGLVALADESSSAHYPITLSHTFFVDYKVPDEPCSTEVGIYAPQLWASQLKEGIITPSTSEAFRLMQPRIYTSFYDILPFILGLGKYNIRMLSLLGSTVYTPRKDWAELFSDLFRCRVVLTQQPKGSINIIRTANYEGKPPYYMQSVNENAFELDEWNVVTQDYNDLVPFFDWLSLVKKVWSHLGEYALINVGLANTKQHFIKADAIETSDDLIQVRRRLPNDISNWPKVPRETLVHKLASTPVPLLEAVKGTIIGESHVLLKQPNRVL
jgi:hypothetical protein